ncbi:CENP-A multicopy suppressor protein 2 [Diplogelasinospora grovesii]|uniref:CENP-A multicopy suppressor protein 2 n=1 Tax=Diplogelasinospora grovesii TaxID=303347 RepID=A0AAN6S8I8_9PEZI|nr:CENP-A multicopy suppressor protein 2 [Diplogelasinospora grovesii]
MMATPSNSWSAPSPHMPAAQPVMDQDDMGLQARPMGLKVQYTFDREGQVPYLARWPQILQIQTIPLDDRTTIGVVELRTCLQAIAQCSPEMVNQQDTDYTIYAYDYSEPDTPLVGQGMFSTGLEQNSNDQQSQQLVTGRVTRNLLAILSNGNRETLEVRLKLTPVAKMQRADFSNSMDAMNMMQSAPTPVDTTRTEWNSFMQSNPTLGRTANVAPMSSPALSTAQLHHPTTSDNRFHDFRHDSAPPQPMRPSSIPPVNAYPQAAPFSSANFPPHAQAIAPKAPVPRDNAASPVPIQPAESATQQQIPSARPLGPSRPASRTRSRSKVPTGRPRGRPRKKPLETGNTSAAEEATDGDEGPQKKRAKVTKVEYTAIAPFGSAPDSLRVTASTSGSLRNLRPVGAGSDAPIANHLHDGPRAPTPVPDALQVQRQARRVALENSRPRSESMADSDSAGMYQSRFSQPASQRSFSQDARSPTESIGQSPDPGYTPEDSPADLGSSPPVPRTSAYLHSSPAPSSPILPTMPMPPLDSGFMSGGMDDFFDDEDIMQNFSQEQPQELPGQTQSQAVMDTAPIPPMPPAKKASSEKGSLPQQQLLQQTNFPFQEVNPGPPELLPTTSIFNPTGKLKVLNRPASAANAGSTPAPQPPKKPASRSFKRSNTAPNALPSELDAPAQEQPAGEHHAAEAPQSTCEPELPQMPNQPSEPQTTPSEEHQQPAEPETENGTAETTQQELPRPDVQNSAQEAPASAPPTAEPSLPGLTLPTSRPASRGPSAPTVPASDPIVDSILTLPRAIQSEAPCPPSDPAEDAPRYNKNLIKKQTIKERLENAIQKGEQPPFCNNCGAIETPTWRKIWCQDHQGDPGFHEFSDKPGCVTMIDVLERDAEGKPSQYRLIKKNLGRTDDRKKWQETLLCNPCGIWFTKFKSHRPQERWEKDFARLNQPRRKRESKGGNSRSKKLRTKSDAQMNPTSEAYFTTDPIGPGDQDESPTENMENGEQSRQQSVDDEYNLDSLQSFNLNLRSSPKQRGPGSTHSRGSGTADSPIAVEDDLGPTRRLLFPSPRKDGVPKVLGELAVNTVQTGPNRHVSKSAAAGGDKENARSEFKRPATPTPDDKNDLGQRLEQELFGTPPACPSTPPPKSASTAAGPFKTPTRPTPSHRPITRSISRSIRSASNRSIPKSPSQALLLQLAQRTPSKTPRSAFGPNGGMLSVSKRRTPRSTGQHLHAHFALDDMQYNGQSDSPLMSTLNQLLLSEANDFTAGSPSHGLVDLDLSSLPNLDSDDMRHLDLSNLLGTDLLMPSSPPLLRDHYMNFGGSLDGGGMESLWAQLNAGNGSTEKSLEMDEADD